jgi:hypothetical protein
MVRINIMLASQVFVSYPILTPEQGPLKVRVPTNLQQNSNVPNTSILRQSAHRFHVVQKSSLAPIHTLQLPPAGKQTVGILSTGIPCRSVHYVCKICAVHVLY